MYPRRLSGPIHALLIAALAMLATLGMQTTAAQNGEVGIIGVAWACPSADVDPGLTTCDTIEGVSIQVAVNGTEIAGSPFTTDLNSIGFNSIEFNAPADTEITLTQLNGVPDGYEPAAGSNPFTANVADLPEGGAGGESTSPYANVVNVPVADETDDAVDGAGDDTDDTEGTTTLPETGAGTAAVSANGDQAFAGLLLAGSVLLTAAGVMLRRLRMR